MDELLGTTEVTSSDYNTVKTLVSGDVDTFLGFKFIPGRASGPDGPATGAASRGPRAVCTSACGTTSRPRSASVPTSRMPPRCTSKGTFGATRTEEKKVVEIICNV